MKSVRSRQGQATSSDVGPRGVSAFVARRLAALLAVLVAAAVLAPASAQATTVIAYPSTNAVVTTGWTSAANAYAADGVFATASPNKNGTVNSDFGGFHFDTSVPAGATVNSVTVEVNWYVSTNASIATLGFQPYVSGTAQGTEFTNTASPIAATIESSVYTGITQAQLLDGTFAVRVRMWRGNSNTAVTAYLDYVRVTVDYTAASGTVTLGGGAANTDANLAPGETKLLDSFTLQVTSGGGTAWVSVLELTLTNPTALASAAIRSAADCTSGTVYGTVNAPTASVSTITLSPQISVTTALSTLYVCATGGTVAAATPITGRITAVTASGFSIQGSDPSSATLTAQLGALTIGNGNGGEPSGGNLDQGQKAALDTFTLYTASGTATVTRIDVALNMSGTPLSAISIQSTNNCTGGTTYGTLATPANGTNQIPLSTNNIIATTATGTTDLYVCATAGTVVSATPVTGNVASATAFGFTATDNDSTNATITVQPPATPTVTIGNGSSEPSSGNLSPGVTAALDKFSLQTNTGPATVTSVSVNLANASAVSRISIRATSCTGTEYGFTTAVNEGANAIAPLSISATTSSGSTDLYVCITGGTIQYPLTVTGNVSSVVASGFTVTDNDTTNASLTVQATPDTTTVGDAANPPNATLDPGAATTTAVDAFTLKTGIFNDTIQLVTVTLPANMWQGIEALSIQSTSACGGTTYGSAMPVGTTVGIGVSGLVASPAIKSLWVCVKPKAHAAMPLPPGGTYAVTANVTGLTSGNTVAYSVPREDTTASATVTIDNQSPANVTWGAVTTGSGSVALSWTNPSDSDFNQALVLRRQGGPVSAVPVEGTPYTTSSTFLDGTTVRQAIANPGSAGSLSDTLNITSGLPYYYAIFAKDSHGNYATGTSFGPVVASATTTAFFAGNTTANSTKPVVGIVNPGSGSVVRKGEQFRVQARVFSPGGASITGVAVTHDNGLNWLDPLYWVTAYGGSPTSSGVWGGTLTIASEGGYTLVVRASNDGGASYVYSRPVGVSVRTQGGDGSLLVRDNASQLCSDCHAMVPHSSEATGSQYGSWSTTCRDCHTPHGTTNIKLVPNAITPPAIGSTSPPPKAVYFTNTTGFASTGGAASRTGSYANSDATGVCQACHTRTQDPVTASARYRTGGGGTTHDANVPCKICHAHSTGFAPTDKGCWNCHLRTGCVGTCDVDVKTWGNWTGPTPIIDTSEWMTYGHGALTSTNTNPGKGAGYYPSDNPTAKFDTMGSAVGDHGCFYCHSSSTSHNDPNNWFRLNPANFNATYVTSTAGDGWNSVCLICHGKIVDPPWSALGFDPDGAGTAYALVAATTKLGTDHYGAHHGNGGNPPDNNGGNFCWDCHDPHGDKSAAATPNELWFMVQRYPVEQTRTDWASTSGVPQTLAQWIEFRGNLGGNSRIDYPDYIYTPSGTSRGICRNCHDDDANPLDSIDQQPGVNHYTKSTSDGHKSAWGTNLSPRDRCTDCHVHAKKCNECHQAPQTAGLHAQHNQVENAQNPPQAYADVSSEATATAYGYRCAKCHQGSHPTDTHSGTSGDPFASETIFDASAEPKNTGGTYTPAGTAQPPVQGVANGAYANLYFGWSIGTCATLYCHSNGAPVDATMVYTTITWQAAGVSWNCGRCHGTQADTSTMSKAHDLHVNTTSGYGYVCERCHASVGTGSAITNKALHANGTKDVQFDSYLGNGAGLAPGSYDKATLKCSNTYCHSNGTDRDMTGASSPPSMAWTPTGLARCRLCHGGDATGTPVIGTLPDTGTTSHKNHVNNSNLIGANIVCITCHSATVSSNTVISNRTNHVNGSPNVSLANVGTRSGGTYSATPSCDTNWCHSDGREISGTTTYAPIQWTTTWTASAVCKGCHGRTSSLAGEPDYSNTTRYNSHITDTAHGGSGKAGVHVPTSSQAAAAASCVRCHSTTVTTAGTAIQNTGKHLDGVRDVSFGNVGTNPGSTAATPYNTSTRACQTYCHSNAAPYDGANYATTQTYPSTLPTWGGTAPSCTQCHAGKDVATPAMSPKHARHINSNTSGYAFGCHLCHYATTTDDVNIIGTRHVDGTRTDVVFDATFGSWAGGTGGTYNASTHQCTNTYCHGKFNGSGNTTNVVSWSSTVDCQSCHLSPPPQTKSGTAHSTDPTCGPGCHTGYTTVAAGTVNYSTHCNGEATGGGGCLTCHGGPQDDTHVTGSRRNVLPDFALRSHHVFSSALTGTNKLTDNDCAVCHAEAVTASQGSPVSTNEYDGDPLSPTYGLGKHKNPSGLVYLRDSDNASIFYQYDVNTMKTLGLTYSANSSNATFKSETSGNSDDALPGASVACTTGIPTGLAGTETNCRKGLDKFCVSCHDADGAAAAPLSVGDVGATAANPFYDAQITNSYDQQLRCVNPGANLTFPNACTTANMRVVDVGSRVAVTGRTSTGGTYASTDFDAAVRPAPNNRPDPPQGIYARHAIRGMSQSVYVGTSGWDTTTYFNRAKYAWASSSVMACEDCHTSDGANGVSGNSHGSLNEYLLKDYQGGPTLPPGSSASANYTYYNCAQCHLGTYYYGGNGVHTARASDWVDTITLSPGSARSGSSGNVFGYACGNCHGGGPPSKAGTGGGLGGFGTIHGTSQIIGVGTNGVGPGTSGLTQRNAYRFMNGDSMRYYDPNDWQSTVNRGCYTLSSGNTDTWGGCTVHSGGIYRTNMPPANRNLAY